MNQARSQATPRRPAATGRAGVWPVSFVVAATLAASCAAQTTSDATLPANVPETVAIGAFPGPLASVEVPLAPTTTVATAVATTTTEASGPITGSIADEVFGNRILLIGDTVLAATAPRFDGVMCDALEAFGWQGEIAAEPGRFVEFGAEVLDARLSPDEGVDFDAVAIMLGNHFDGNVDNFSTAMGALVARVAPRPVLLYTLNEDDTFQADLNEVLRDLPRFNSNVALLDWAEIVDEDRDVLAADTPSGLTEEGLSRLAVFTVAKLGEPAGDADPGCVESVFVDDSAIVL